jgi:hypothetical protein
MKCHMHDAQNDSSTGAGTFGPEKSRLFPFAEDLLHVSARQPVVFDLSG